MASSDSFSRIQEADTFNSFLSDSSEQNFNSQATSNSNQSITVINKVSVKLSKGISSHKYCFICHENNGLLRIKTDPRFDVLAKTNIFIAEGSRLCPCHENEKGFVNDADLKLIKSIHGVVNFDENSIKQLICNLKEAKYESQIFFQYSSSSPIQEDILKLTGLEKIEFLYLMSYLHDIMNKSAKRSKEQALFVYLFWLRTGMTMEIEYFFSKFRFLIYISSLRV